MFRKKLNLQLFAEAGTAGAEGASSADSQLATGTTDSQLVTGTADNNQLATGEGAQGQKATFEELINGDYKKDFEAKTKEIMKQRFKHNEQMQARMDMVNPVMELFARKYGIDATEMSDDVLKQITDKIMGDDAFYEEEAMAKGLDASTVRAMHQQERETAELRKFKEDTLRNQESEKRFRAMYQEAEVVKQTYPGFNLDAELQNKAFQRLVWGAGVPLKTAYEVMHHDEIMAAGMQVTAKRTAQQISNDIQAGTYRPAEGAISGQSAALSTGNKTLSAKEREDIKARARAGERIVL